MEAISAIHINSLKHDYAGEGALKGLSLEVTQGTLFGLIGADGAGKTTLMTILATLRDVNQGQIQIFGLDIQKDYKALRQQIGYMPQRFSLYADLSVGENLEFFADLFGLTHEEKKKRIAELLIFSALCPFTDRRAGALSGGMKQKLALSCILLHEPKLLLLDEPTVGVDPVARRDFWILLRSLRDRGITILVSTPYMDEANLCDELVLLHEGMILAQGNPNALLNQFPLALWSVEAARPLRWPVQNTPPSLCESMYAMGGHLHVLTKANENRGDIEKSLKHTLGDDIQISIASPLIEDLFLSLLNGVLHPSDFKALK